MILENVSKIQKGDDCKPTFKALNFSFKALNFSFKALNFSFTRELYNKRSYQN